MAQADRFLHFGCPQCTARLKAPKLRAGTRGRCPWCHYVFTVPRESRFPGRTEAYAVHGPDWTPPDEDDWPTYIAVRCALCGTRLVASEEEVGQWIECPDCGSTTQVPAHREIPAAARNPPPRPTEVYSVCEGPGQPPPSRSAVYGRYFPVFCRRCSTRMLAGEEQVGQSLICPDCGTATPVPPPQARSPKDLPSRPTEIYALRASDELPPSTQGSPAPYPFACPRCGTRLHATADQQGQTAVCPDCTTPITIPRPPPSRPSPGAAEEPKEIYGIRPAIEPPSLEIPGYEPVRARRPLPRIEQSEAQHSPPRAASLDPTVGSPPAAPRPAATSARPSSERMDEAYAFLFAPGVRNLWLFLSVGLAFFFYGMGEAARLIPSEDGRVVVLALGMLVFAGLVAVVVFVVGSAYLLTMLRETAAGCEEIENWPDNFLDYLFEGLGVIVAAAVAVGLSVGLDRLAVDAGAPRGVVLAIGTFLLFPLLLLSVLESELPFVPFSIPILRSVLAAWPVWLRFYLRAVLVVGLAVGASVGGLVLGGFWAVLPAAALLGAAIILYFRLLGRLASHASQRLADFDARRATRRRKPRGQAS